MLIASRNQCSHIIRYQRHFTDRISIIWSSLEQDLDGHLAVSTFHDPYQTMTGAIFARPSVVAHPLIRPGSQGLYRHKVGKHELVRRTGKARLKHVAPAQVTLRAWNCVSI